MLEQVETTKGTLQLARLSTASKRPQKHVCCVVYLEFTTTTIV